ncbi:beta-lactamase/transpeptidase-like protein [Lyophyllum atratum]|nr:beta-lactamase/transpeptidase-like protein [Lyophyllum atratum]
MSSEKILDDETEKFVNQILMDWKSPGGLSIAFVKKNEQGDWVNIETKGYGRANAAGAKVTENTLFNMASNSKLFTVIATGLLINNETITPRFNWDSKISDLIPEFNVTDPVAAKEACIIDLLSHRTGYPRHEFAYRYNDTVPDVVSALPYWRQSTEFRDIWQYNNNMYTLMSQLPPQLLNGTPLARYVKENIFDRLSMNSTTYSYEIAEASGHRADGMTRKDWDLYTDVFAGTPAAAKWWSGTSGGEDGNEGRNPVTNETVIPNSVLTKAATAVIPQSLRPEFPEVSLIAYGAAQVQISYRNHLIIEHPGFVRGFNSQISRLPNDGVGVAVLTNDHEYGKLISQLVKYYIMDRALGLEPIDWSTRLMAQKTTPPPRATPRPKNAILPSANYTTYAGKYKNDGYGTFELCLATPTNPFATGTCNDLLKSLPTILPNATRPGIPTYFAAIDSPWFSHMRVEHFNRDLFNVSYLISTVRSPLCPSLPLG